MNAVFARRMIVMMAVVLGLVTGILPAESGKCPEQTTVSVSSKNGAYDTGIDWSDIQTVLAIKSSSVGVTSYTVYLANFEFTEATHTEINKLKLAEGQGMLQFTLVNQVEGQKDVIFKSGFYDFSKAQGYAEQTGSVQIRVKNGTSISFSYHYAEGEFEVIEVTEDTFCGKFILKDKFSQLAGEFAAPVK